MKIILLEVYYYILRTYGYIHYSERNKKKHRTEEKLYDNKSEIPSAPIGWMLSQMASHQNNPQNWQSRASFLEQKYLYVL